MSDAMEKALNDQINAEYHSSYIYLAMAAYFESVNIPYLVATLISAKELKKYVQQIQRFQIWVSVEDGTKALENFLFYFNVDENPD